MGNSKNCYVINLGGLIATQPCHHSHLGVLGDLSAKSTSGSKRQNLPLSEPNKYWIQCVATRLIANPFLIQVVNSL